MGDKDNTLVIMKNESFWGVDIKSTIRMRKVKSLLKQTTPFQICTNPFLNSPEYLYWFRRMSKWIRANISFNSLQTWSSVHRQDFMGQKMLNTINLTWVLSNGCLAQRIMRYPNTLKVLGSTPGGWEFFLFFRSRFVLFLLKRKKNIEEAFCSINSLGSNVRFDSKPKKARTHFLIWDYY